MALERRRAGQLEETLTDCVGILQAWSVASQGLGLASHIGPGSRKSKGEDTGFPVQPTLSPVQPGAAYPPLYFWILMQEKG